MDKQRKAVVGKPVQELPVFFKSDLSNPKSLLNLKRFSGKRAGSLIAAYNATTKAMTLHIAQGSKSTDDWTEVGSGGGGGGPAGDVVADRVKVYGLSTKPDGTGQGTHHDYVDWFDNKNQEYIFRYPTNKGTASNITLDKANGIIGIPKMVTGQFTINTDYYIEGTINSNDVGSATWVRMEVYMYARAKGQPWPAVPVEQGTVDIREGGNRQGQWYFKKAIPANMDFDQEIQIRYKIIQWPEQAGFDLFINRGNWNKLTIDYCAIANPDLYEIV